MGVYLSTPCKEVVAEEGSGNGLRYAAGEMQVRLAAHKEFLQPDVGR